MELAEQMVNLNLDEQAPASTTFDDLPSEIKYKILKEGAKPITIDIFERQSFNQALRERMNVNSREMKIIHNLAREVGYTNSQRGQLASLQQRNNDDLIRMHLTNELIRERHEDLNNFRLLKLKNLNI